MSDSIINIYLVWRRYFLLYKKDFILALTTTFVEPILLVLSLGFGLAALITSVKTMGHELTYRQFVFSALVGQRLLYTGFFQSSYGSYFRVHYQKIFQNIAATPITLSEVIWGELLWDATEAFLSSSIIVIVGIITGDFHFWGSLCAIPFCFLAGIMFSGIGLWITGISKTINQVSYPQYLLVVPMFLFCGVFFPIENLPPTLQIFTWIFPLTPTISILRTMLLQLPLQIEAPFLFMFWLIFLVYFSKRSIKKSLIK
jgi:lipooligosaccharide transport system permease protein